MRARTHAHALTQGLKKFFLRVNRDLSDPSGYIFDPDGTIYASFPWGVVALRDAANGAWPDGKLDMQVVWAYKPEKRLANVALTADPHRLYVSYRDGVDCIDLDAKDDSAADATAPGGGGAASDTTGGTDEPPKEFKSVVVAGARHMWTVGGRARSSYSCDACAALGMTVIGNTGDVFSLWVSNHPGGPLWDQSVALKGREKSQVHKVALDAEAGFIIIGDDDGRLMCWQNGPAVVRGRGWRCVCCCGVGGTCVRTPSA